MAACFHLHVPSANGGMGCAGQLVATVRYFGRLMTMKVDHLFHEVRRNVDTQGYRLAKGMG
jgi:hypothetical protein